MKIQMLSAAVLAVLAATGLTAQAAGGCGGCGGSGHGGHEMSVAEEGHKGHGEATAPATGSYPLETCVVSGEKLGEMGDPVILQYEGREVRFCCNKCVKKFKQEPAKYLKKLDEAARAKPGAKAGDAQEGAKDDAAHHHE